MINCDVLNWNKTDMYSSGMFWGEVGETSRSISATEFTARHNQRQFKQWLILEGNKKCSTLNWI